MKQIQQYKSFFKEIKERIRQAQKLLGRKMHKDFLKTKMQQGREDLLLELQDMNLRKEAGGK